MPESPPYDAVADLCRLRPALLVLASELSDAAPEGEDSPRGNARNLADALECLGFMEGADAVAHARAHVPVMVERVRPALEREGFDGAELARELGYAVKGLGE